MTHDPQRCGGRRKDGRPCRAWAARGSDPPRCASHLNQVETEENDDDEDVADPAAGGFYESGYNIKEATGLLYKSGDQSLKAELRVTRMAMRRALEQLRCELDPVEYARLIELIFKGAHTVADIMRAQRALAGGDKDLIPPEVDEAITYVLRKKGKKS
jgi:hypothetical protein